VVVWADIPMVGVMTGNEAVGKGMAFGMGAVTFGRGMFTTVTISASALKLSVWEFVLDSPSFFIPWVLGFQFSCLSVDR
jgi:hypothetical protein